ncbi:MAG TPA: N-acetyltransferase [Phenylobacterium sp.]|jgi:predicted N-acetyltransferase YhbS|uniref:GNAT family N-acetyltransferase n=1 Tax=Phenylobacterium sp. TaxID=1871053 RepID=UPI002D73DC3E|nr:N-acetyltransferase [Phenylobacterium sp.]HZZ66677.1 N-acetyltransferase [Phenylobacterium sp.]
MSAHPNSAQPGAPPPALILQPERPQDGPLVDALIERAFGPGRYVKASERVREFATFAPELSVCAWSGERLLGCARMWHVRVGGQPVMFLGPFAVEQGERSAGFGARLVARACEAAQATGATHVVLVGDEPYFSRVGFATALGRQVILPGPVDQRRVLVRALTPDAGELVGPIEPA